MSVNIQVRHGFFSSNTLNNVEKAFSVVSGISVMLLMLFVSVQVISRFLFNYSFMGLYEISEQLIIPVVYFTLALVQQTDSHIKMDILFVRLRPLAKRIVKSFTLLLSFAICLALTVETWKHAYEAFENQSVSMGVLPFLLWPVKVIVPIGAALLTIRIVLQIVQIITGSARTEPVINKKH